MQINIKRFLQGFCLLILPVILHAQPKDNNPLTIFGLGDIVSRDFVHSETMGGLGASYTSNHLPNIVNPASLAYLESTSLNIDLFAKYSAIKKNDVDESVWSGNIDAFSISMPILNPINDILERRENEVSWGMNLTLRPNTRIGYDIQSMETIDSVGMVEYKFTGNGGTYDFTWANGVSYRNLSLGVTLGYMFGQADYTLETDFPDLINDYRHKRILEQGFSGFVWNAGLLWRIPVDKTRKDDDVRKTRFVNIGLYYNGQRHFTSKTDLLDYVQNTSYNTADTAVYVQDERDKGVLPSEFGIGIMYEHMPRMKVGINFSASPWSDYDNPLRPETLKDSWRIGFGGAYTPDATSITSFLERVEYRIGFHYLKDPRVLQGEQGFEYGISAGVGLPFILPRQFSFVNLGLEYGRRGMKTTLKENYFTIHVGLSLNDNQWFVKRRYN